MLLCAIKKVLSSTGREELYFGKVAITLFSTEFFNEHFILFPKMCDLHSSPSPSQRAVAD
jgi:hypothetical protein